MTRSTASRRARNSDSDRIGGRVRRCSRPSRRRWRLASRRVDPVTPCTSSRDAPGLRTRTTVTHAVVVDAGLGVAAGTAAPATATPAGQRFVLVAVGLLAPRPRPAPRRPRPRRAVPLPRPRPRRPRRRRRRPLASSSSPSSSSSVLGDSASASTGVGPPRPARRPTPRAPGAAPALLGGLLARAGRPPRGPPRLGAAAVRRAAVAGGPTRRRRAAGAGSVRSRLGRLHRGGRRRQPGSAARVRRSAAARPRPPARSRCGATKIGARRGGPATGPLLRPAAPGRPAAPARGRLLRSRATPARTPSRPRRPGVALTAAPGGLHRGGFGGHRSPMAQIRQFREVRRPGRPLPPVPARVRAGSLGGLDLDGAPLSAVSSARAAGGRRLGGAAPGRVGRAPARGPSALGLGAGHTKDLQFWPPRARLDAATQGRRTVVSTPARGARLPKSAIAQSAARKLYRDSSSSRDGPPTSDPSAIGTSSAQSGSTISPCAVSLPWASRVTRGGTGGSRSATTRKPASTSSGRTEGSPAARRGQVSHTVACR